MLECLMPARLFYPARLEYSAAATRLWERGSIPIAETAIFARPSRTFRVFSEVPGRHLPCLPSRMPEDKRFVYVLKSADSKPHFYIGLTHDVRARLADHNAGRCLQSCLREAALRIRLAVSF
jgi:hypothetical protein